ncbi:MAG TPA: phosphatidate cytidylyltransferase [Candidatus Limnocylindria bacterium]|nr:phosphatidate cytidylyltransferase [Candidatus Limnocylindria bacterium]
MTAPGEARTAVAAPPAKAAKGSRWSLALRVVSGLLFLPLLILLARAGGWAFWVFVAVQVALGLAEFYRMMQRRGLRPYVRLGIAAALGLLWVCLRPHTPHVAFLLTSVLLLVLALELRRPEARQRVEDIAVTCFGVLYVGWLSAHLVLLRELPWRAGTSYADGASFVLLAFLVTWSCDTGAYAVGRVFGRNRPWTRISPRKSVEGAFGGLAAAVIAAFVARAWFAPYLDVRDAALLGVLVGVFAQVGDLVESLLKRDAEHGDSSELIPGHGGVLDRFDSLYFAAPVVFYYLMIVVFGVP